MGNKNLYFQNYMTDYDKLLKTDGVLSLNDRLCTNRNSVVILFDYFFAKMSLSEYLCNRNSF